MIFIIFPVWIAFFAAMIWNRESLSDVYMGLSIVTAAFILSWQLFTIAKVCNRKDKKKDERQE